MGAVCGVLSRQGCYGCSFAELSVRQGDSDWEDKERKESLWAAFLFFLHMTAGFMGWEKASKWWREVRRRRSVIVTEYGNRVGSSREGCHRCSVAALG